MSTSSNTAHLGSKLTMFISKMFPCWSAQDDSDAAPSIQISGPTNFRREEINIPGMTPEEERFVRGKADADARRMYQNLRPLASSPSQNFAERPPPQPMAVPTYEQFAEPRVPAIPSRAAPGPPQVTTTKQRMVAHGRKISDSFRKPYFGTGEEGEQVELRSWVEDAAIQGENAPAADTVKTSEESSETGSRKASKGEIDTEP